jgi:hypothetical protein
LAILPSRQVRWFLANIFWTNCLADEPFFPNTILTVNNCGYEPASSPLRNCRNFLDWACESCKFKK